MNFLLLRGRNVADLRQVDRSEVHIWQIINSLADNRIKVCLMRIVFIKQLELQTVHDPQVVSRTFAQIHQLGARCGSRGSNCRSIVFSDFDEKGRNEKN